uniref:Uncharacterized protein n=1 Tax=Salix viminalis TaxID=40686 RepID=A0A6N2NIC2_SALVM
MYPPGTSIRTLTCSYCNAEQVTFGCYIFFFSIAHEQSIAMIVTNVFSSLTIIVFGLGRALAGEIIVNFGEFYPSEVPCAKIVMDGMWYIFEETALCLWTGILYITYLKANILRVWWKDAVMILLLVTLSIALILLLIFHRQVFSFT